MSKRNQKIITITYGRGEGRTKLAAFDAALWDAGIANYNLIKLTSIMPEDYSIKVKKVDYNNIDYGNKLYVVLSEIREDRVNMEIWAGLGWAITRDKKTKVKRGFFVEHQATNKKKVIELILNSLESMKEYRPDKLITIGYKVIGIKCVNQPVCALVAAVYKSEGWS